MKRTLKFITNKYLIATLVFIGLILFFSPYDIFTIRAEQKTLQELNDKIEYLNSESDRMNNEINQLETDTLALEKRARELYYQKKDNEDVYIVK
ncbi:MAG TPA: septum formation initiator family protein [Edaphocola sp.]|nr:septum formation initiator family protein [Edaphocola sp.]